MLLKILKLKPETADSTSIIFTKPDNFDFYPGQYLDLKLPIQDIDKRGKTRAFSISSSPTEDFLMITYKHGISDFKKHLAKLKTGDTVEVSHPAGTFILDETEPAVFLTGGVGITPFRSMIKYVLDNQLTTPIHLFYSNSTENFLFKKDLDNYQHSLHSLTISYIKTSQKNRLTKAEILNSQLSLNSIFYLAGSHGFVNGMEKILLKLKVDELNIRYDRFDGYL